MSALDLAELYDTHARDLHYYLARRVGPQTADDLVADAFLAVWEHRDRYDPARASPKAWLYGVATTLLRNHVRREHRRLRAWARESGRAMPVDDFGARVAESADAGILAGQAAAVLAELRSEERDALLLVAWAGLSPSEISAVLDVPVSTVRSRLHRARTRLRTALTVKEDNHA
ncbi:RNA polymerase sigma-70 factor (ECF subfamily) [Kibdelosporangium banguiense]|uniref:RNA polymerase sigma-70 factor (ECF subfamily) n=1 Tax=Kibdelosporangium banguiense TaxID=1365924 RepID=A0ABS4T5U2_9PSEU|nr:RNA polymerase sigma factor [Kibdelosporangium banguiense]MBP2319837.1 RNA polymerase sigma-70 factor (ECF subfamily) [Kibdelosporangium banguiense]